MTLLAGGIPRPVLVRAWADREGEVLEGPGRAVAGVPEEAEQVGGVAVAGEEVLRQSGHAAREGAGRQDTGGMEADVYDLGAPLVGGGGPPIGGEVARVGVAAHHVHRVSGGDGSGDAGGGGRG